MSANEISYSETSSKLFAYLIPEYKPSIMNNIKDTIKTDFGELNFKKYYDLVDFNISNGDIESYTTNSNTHYPIPLCNKSLVLVKFIKVNDLFDISTLK